MLFDILYEVVQDSGCGYLDIQVALVFPFHSGYNYIRMTKLGAMSKLHWEVKLLGELNNALLILQTQALGQSSELNFSPEDAEKSREFLIKFCQRFSSVLKESSSTDLTPYLQRFEEKFVADLETIVEHLRQDKITESDIGFLEGVLSCFIDQFAADFRRLLS